ncbi:MULTISPECIES: ABC transporter [unclassified Photobacterium]|uniref:ABC transporter n=1 Tax=unclassified Photobacterium TaxID=2628852 RepID=UPI000D17A0FD|nr:MULTISPECIES: ABC transporter [unclassified Photobacterium]PSV27325.1 ABC transporter [Photobacterium sp. GB-56]PSV41106.1 ABC transporter [Photobacterium sp. GB-210]PSV47791.1 ABC transporter [Photobacterium sp. GB-36]PSV58737.1 ABC transporter [Photobacterium sp. GB-3]
MNPIKALLTKELLEHKLVTRLPLFLAAFSIICIILIMSNSQNFSFNVQSSGLENWSPNFTHSDSFAGIAGLINFMLAGLVTLVSFFTYTARTLSKERKEGSLAFWHSMPVSDAKAIAVKLIFALVIIPIITSFLLLFADLTVWCVGQWFLPQSLLTDYSVNLVALGQHYGEFISTMAAMSLALLPVACIIFFISQFNEHPLITIFVIILLIKIMGSIVFNSSAIGDWISQVNNLSINILMSDHPWGTLMAIGSPTLMGLFIIAVIFFILTVRFRSGK